MWSNLFRYDQGKLIWLVSRNSKGGKTLGKPAGFPNSNGYLRVGIDGERFYVHRIIWEMHNGPIPRGYEIDHINGDRADNRLENLRLATWS